MEIFKGIKSVIVSFLVVLPILTMTVSGQITTACTNSMISTFTPCLNFITGSTGNGSASPTSGCCSSLGSLVQSGTDCACLILTGNVPLQLPINRTLAISLPRACNMASVPLQCKASATPLPSPGPVAFGPTLPPTAASSPETESPALAPLPETSTPSPESTPTATPVVPGLRPVLTPSSASKLSNMYSPYLPLGVLGIILLKNM